MTNIEKGETMEELGRLLQRVKESNDPAWRHKVEPLLEEIVLRLLALEVSEGEGAA